MIDIFSDWNRKNLYWTLFWRGKCKNLRHLSLLWVKQLTYVKEQWPYLTNYLKDGRLELSNNRAERSIKPFVIDRKNFPVCQYT